MSRDFVTVQMAALDYIEAYDLLTSVVSPRPIALVSTCAMGGHANLAPYSFYTLGGSNPPSVLFSSILNNDSSVKVSLRNAIDTGEFVLNAVDQAMVEGVNSLSAGNHLRGGEWRANGSTPVDSLRVHPPRIGESPVQLECSLVDVISHGDGPNSARYVVGEVLIAHVSTSWADRIQHLRLTGKLAGSSYLDTATGQEFELRSKTTPGQEIG